MEPFPAPAPELLLGAPFPSGFGRRELLGLGPLTSSVVGFY